MCFAPFVGALTYSISLYKSYRFGFLLEARVLLLFLDSDEVFLRTKNSSNRFENTLPSAPSITRFAFDDDTNSIEFCPTTYFASVSKLQHCNAIIELEVLFQTIDIWAFLRFNCNHKSYLTIAFLYVSSYVPGIAVGRSLTSVPMIGTNNWPLILE